MIAPKPSANRSVHTVVCLWLLSAGVATLGAQSATSEATYNIVAAREQVVDYARDIKAKFQESDPIWQGARDRYRKAYSEFNALIATVKGAIRTGKTKDLENDAAFQNAAAEASACSKEFIKFVQLKTASRTRDSALIGNLLNQGSKIFSAIQAAKAESRDQAAEAFEKDVIWPRWEDIK